MARHRISEKRYRTPLFPVYMNLPWVCTNSDWFKRSYFMLASHQPIRCPDWPAMSEANRDETIRCRLGTPFTLAEWRAMRTFASIGTRESYNIVRLPDWYDEGVLFITTLSCVVHIRLPIGRRRRAILNMFNIARHPPNGLLCESACHFHHYINFYECQT